MHNLAKDLIESDEAFREQFDRSHPSYHGGDNTPVITGGAIVPNSMKGECSDWTKLPIHPDTAAETSYGKEVEGLMSLRTTVGDIKKNIEQCCKPIDSIIKLKEANKTITSNEIERGTQEGASVDNVLINEPNNEICIDKNINKDKNNKNINKEENNKKLYILTIRKLMDKFPKETEKEMDVEGSVRVCVCEFLDDVVKEYDNREEYGSLLLKTKTIQSRLFNIQKTLLNDIKDAKKKYNNN
eukprot:GHVR01114413.1.p1 GENE.GHVR01114413.1~~GHVR01114413.1.p1  ORF type:complete len:242 (+),score=81.57 GHVR01114413.1:40-765(+)